MLSQFNLLSDFFIHHLVYPPLYPLNSQNRVARTPGDDSGSQTLQMVEETRTQELHLLTAPFCPIVGPKFETEQGQILLF